MDEQQNFASTLNSEEKLLALFSHLSVFFGGLIVPLIFWIINKDKSKFVVFHALQSLFYHIVYIVFIIFFVMIIAFGSMGFSLVFAKNVQHSAGPSVFFIILLVAVYGLLLLSILGFIGYAIYMAIKAYQGELCKYPIIGKIIYKKVYGVS
jgi:uncharacterized protein